MTPLLFAASLSTDGKIAIGVGAVLFIILFFKLLVGFLKFCLRHPILFIILLLCGGLGFAFHFLLAGIVVLAILGGGLVFFALDQFNQ
ncbi:hypothetical protein FC84_GL000932 [Lapidilactobacillus dextrinicus DSM 20335]|uniref:Uncharacterized protein n=1 Tax=Lapidilactobacillus dextrinicus DSM 20335 TaxID=1423738 RepID=A0A0R2BFI0_9LACO|nr:hypothetical protein [Lapidilactobacillus dextrinicus]KRM78397.1 hypothetical protein FC84_GL000932 [Lapidilactobacillus dextrinicus DSM 20335]QFG46556.1 hypothetical protein LH506_03455 [Lapidilactobacillus dextrinicus]